MKLAGYLRVSTDRQADVGLGLDVQERAIRGWARHHRHRLVDVHRDEGRSGALEAAERPGLTSALADIHDGRARGLVVARLDRLARALTVQEAVLARIWADAGNVYAVDVGEIHRDDPADPMRTAMRQMVGVFAQLEKAMIVARMRGGRELKASRGGYAGGKPPYGYRAHQGELVDEPAEQEVLRRIRGLSRAGSSTRAIAAELNAAGIPSRTGRPWHSATVARILSR